MQKRSTHQKDRNRGFSRMICRGFPEGRSGPHPEKWTKVKFSLSSIRRVFTRRYLALFGVSGTHEFKRRPKGRFSAFAFEGDGVISPIRCSS